MNSWRIMVALIFTIVAGIVFCFADELLGIWCLGCAIMVYLTEIWRKIDNLKK